jgi:hypothetical protein
VLFVRPGWSPALVSVRVTGDPATSATEAVEVELHRAARITGTVSGGRADQVVRGEVKGYELLRRTGISAPSPDGFGADFESTAKLDARGAFTLEDVPAHVAIQLTLTEEDRQVVLVHAPSPVQLDPGATHEVAWKIEVGGTFVCTVREADGQPSADVELWLAPSSAAQVRVVPVKLTGEPSQRARTDASGVAVFDNVQPGAWILALAPLPMYSTASSCASAAVPQCSPPRSIRAPVKCCRRRSK